MNDDNRLTDTLPRGNGEGNNRISNCRRQESNLCHKGGKRVSNNYQIRKCFGRDRLIETI